MVQKRVEDHLQRNQDGKLTSEQAELKMKKKHGRDLQREAKVAVFKITSKQLSAQTKFKIDMNSQQYHMSGIFMVADQHTCPDVPHIVIVEGGQTAVKRYKNLMLRRLNWGSSADNNSAEVKMDENTKISVDGECSLVWEGGSIAQNNTAKKWKVVDIRSEHEARRILAERNSGQYLIVPIKYAYQVYLKLEKITGMIFFVKYCSRLIFRHLKKKYSMFYYH